MERNQSTMSWINSKTLCDPVDDPVMKQDLQKAWVISDQTRSGARLRAGSSSWTNGQALFTRVRDEQGLFGQLVDPAVLSAALALWPRVSLLLSAALSAVIHTISAVSSHWSVLSYKLMEQTVIKSTVWRTSYYSTSWVTQFLLSQKNKCEKKADWI